MSDIKAKSKTNLVDQLSAELRELIVSGELKVGEKLPSEADLTKSYSVSRTVIREALSALRSDGLVESRQGAGVFVIEEKESGIGGFSKVDPERLSSVIEMLELRAAIEIEAAGLAALRRSPAQDDMLFELLNGFISNARSGRSTTDLDREFHLAIAAATNNPRFAELLNLMGENVIPRRSLFENNSEKSSTQVSLKYLELIHTEHLQIAEAISSQDESAAREAMRNHLKGSQNRYRNLLRNK